MKSSTSESSARLNNSYHQSAKYISILDPVSNTQSTMDKSESAPDIRIQPWKGHWPQNIGDRSVYLDKAIFSKALSGRGATPNMGETADGSRIFRLDTVDDLLGSIDAAGAKTL